MIEEKFHDTVGMMAGKGVVDIMRGREILFSREGIPRCSPVIVRMAAVWKAL